MRSQHAWPPTLPEFLQARHEGRTSEQRALDGRLREGDGERQALPVITQAELLARGAERAKAAGQALASPSAVGRSERNIRNGTWTREMEAPVRESMRALGMRYVEPDWPELEARP